MPNVRAFRGLVYATEKRDVTPFVAPPYDVLDERKRDTYLSKSPWNIVHIDLQPKISEDLSEHERYERAKQLYEAWIREAHLHLIPKEGFYLSTQTYSLAGRPLTRVGLIGLVDVLALKEGGILPHERTFEGPKKDRLQLLRSIQAHLSQIFLFYQSEQDPSLEIWDSIDKEAYLREAYDADHVLHRLYAIEDLEAIERVRAHFLSKRLYVADGHHRLETSLIYAKERMEAKEETDGPHRYTLAFLCNMNQPGLKVLGYHRLLKPPFGHHLEESLKRVGFVLCEEKENPYPEDVERSLSELKSKGGIGIGLLKKTPAGIALRLALLHKEPHDTLKSRLIHEGLDESVANLDVAIIDRMIIEEALGLHDADKKKEGIVYEPDLQKSMEFIERGEVQGGIILNPLTPKEVVRVSDARQKMPQKSTYFFPKLLTGLVVYDLNRSF
jgi:uncharacterized protein (DUF1015 family)